MFVAWSSARIPVLAMLMLLAGCYDFVNVPVNGIAPGSRVRVRFAPARVVTLRTPGDELLPITLGELRGRVLSERGDTLDLVLTQARLRDRSYVRPVPVDFRARIVSGSDARVGVQQISAARSIAVVAIPVAIILYMQSRFRGW